MLEILLELKKVIRYDYEIDAAQMNGAEAIFVLRKCAAGASDGLPGTS